ncbi:DUF6701 domain-containing protein [Ferrimonas balearica]|uniref:DUF6701 domain-containing protein n=1 Tax=Ferrimonas balearica TaxID=44012 RepID=UPI001C9887F0|nr:DUF6701 domain-containing protein [Ferrimonas balearica]MBY6225342.1 hypothetical protein [Ferrimonas balearica]
MTSWRPLLTLLLSLWTSLAMALPQCDLIFSKPPSGGHEDDIVLPPNTEADGSLYVESKCNGRGLCNSPYRLSPTRDYYFDTLSIVGSGHSEAQLTIPDSPDGVSTRLFVNSLEIDHGSLNWNGAPEDLVIIVYGDAVFTQAKIKGILYADDDVSLTGQVQFEGAIAAGDDYKAEGNSNVMIDLDALDKGDLSGICENAPPLLAFGTAQLDSNGTGSVSFEARVTPPVLFLTPAISPNNTNNQGATTVRVVDFVQDGSGQYVGVNIAQMDPPRRSGAIVPGALASVDYLLASEGIHRYSGPGNDQLVLEVGRISSGRYQGKRAGDSSPGISSGWETVNFTAGESGTPALLTQMQTLQSGLFQTVTAQNVSAGSAQLTIEHSETSAQLTRKQTIGYLAAWGGGQITLPDGVTRQVAAGRGLTHDRGTRTRDLQAQCNHLNDFPAPFARPPLFWSNRNTRNGGDGGWARRCQLTSTQFSVVNDEDQALDLERSHYAESVGYLAIEAAAQSQLYYRIEHDGDAVTCQGEPVTIKVCNDADCNALATQPVNVVLSPATGWEGGNSLTVTGQATAVLWQGQPGAVNVSLTGGVAGPVSCLVGGTEVGSNQCIINYQRSALLLEPGAPLGCRDETLVVKAVRASDSDPRQCVPAITGQQSVDFTLSALSPAAPVGNPVFRIGGQALPFNTSQSRTLTFNRNGEATLAANYSDVGQLSLAARYQQDQSGEDIELAGSSDFVVAPAGLHLSSPDSNALCASGDASCSAFVAAGTDFNVSVTPVCWQRDGDTDFSDNPVVQNFVHSGVPIEPQLVAPSGGQPSTSGSVSVPVQLNKVPMATTQVSEVGNYRWQLAANAGGQRQIDYMGRTISAYSADTLGRFTPAYLAVVPNVPSLAGCNGMGYLAQPLGFATAPRLTIKGVNANGQVTQNYNSAFWRLSTSLTPRSYADASGRPAIDEALAGTLREDNVGDTSKDRELWLEGTQIAYRRSPALVAPFDAEVDMTIDASALTDQDGICYGDGSRCDALVIENIGGLEARYGRLVLDNVYGTESQALTLPVRAEYYDGSQFVRNGLDSCTLYQASSLSVADGTLSVSGGGTLSAGRGRVTIAPAGRVLDTLVEYQLTYPHYLQWYWGRAAAQDDVARQCVAADGSTDRLCNPKARVTFGRYRGHDKVIYRRERLSD